MELKQSQALEFIGQHPAEFLRLSGRRIVRFWIEPRNSWWFAVSLLAWIGLIRALFRDFVRAAPYVIVMLGFPLVYYITHTFSTYRHPIEPIMLVLASSFLMLGLRHYFSTERSAIWPTILRNQNRSKIARRETTVNLNSSM
jgi:hypothetical protein